MVVGSVVVNSLEFDADAFTAFETAGWAARAEEYHDFFAAIATRVADVVLDAGHVDKTSRVLDVATGPGYLAAGSARRGASVIGIDIANQMLRVARRLHPGIDFRQADAERLPFPDDSFDAVVGNFAILHFARPEQAVAEFRRVLAPGGMVALSTWDTPERCRLAGVFVDAVAEVGAPPPIEVPPGPSFFRFSSDTELTALLGGAGLVAVKIHTVSFAHPVPSADALWHGLLDGTVRTRALVYGQPAETQRKIRAAFDRIVRSYQRDGGLQIPVSVRVAAARKPPKSGPGPS
jgi:SAM-dependent methyltransferase